MRKKLLFLAMGFLIAAAQAQAPLSPATPPEPTAAPAASGSSNCAPMDQHGDASPGSTVGQGSQPLSEKLAKSNGVLCPPSEVDPAMRAPTPDKGNTPVIPPPGSPGGNPNLQPK